MLRRLRINFLTAECFKFGRLHVYPNAGEFIKGSFCNGIISGT